MVSSTEHRVAGQPITAEEGRGWKDETSCWVLSSPRWRVRSCILRPGAKGTGAPGQQLADGSLTCLSQQAVTHLRVRWEQVRVAPGLEQREE